jgi:hypothetical protein
MLNIYSSGHATVNVNIQAASFMVLHPETYAGGSVATGGASHAGQVKG